MAGANLTELRRWTNGMDEEDVRDSARAWRRTASALTNVQEVLREVAPDLKVGFGDSDIGRASEQAFVAAADRLQDQQEPMSEAAGALGEVRLAMSQARATDTGSPQNAPGPAPQPDETPGIPIVADLKHAIATAQHNAEVSAFNSADQEAGKRLVELNKSYTHAIEVFTKIHGDPYVPVDPDGTPGGDGPGGRTPAPLGPRSPIPVPDTGNNGGNDHDLLVFDPHDPDVDTDHDDNDNDVDNDVDNGVDRDPHLPEVPVIDPSGPEGPDGGPGGGPSVHPGLIGGGLAAAGLVSPGAINGIRNLLSRGGGAAPAPIGASSRAAGPGAIGRSGATGSAGSPVGRGGGRGGVGAPGSAGRGAGGRGAAGGRGPGGVGGAGGGRGRSKDRREGAEQDLYDDGQDWIDDEGAAPGVLG